MSLFADYIKKKAKEDMAKNVESDKNKTKTITTKDTPQTQAIQNKEPKKTWITIDPPVKVRAKSSTNTKILPVQENKDIARILTSGSGASSDPKKDQENITKTSVKDQSKISNKGRKTKKTDDDPASDQDYLENDPVLINQEIQMNQWITKTVNDFILATNQVWRCMHDAHISPIKNMFKIDLIDTKNTPLTRYVNYAKKIRDSQIRLPDWFILSNGSKQQKIIPCYDTEIDFMSMCLIDSLSARGKTMIMFHTSESMMRNGMHVSDAITRNLFKAFANIFCLNYIRRYVTSPEQCFMMKDHYLAYYEHIKYGLLEPNLKRMILVSSRQIHMIIKILKEMRSHLVDELLLINLKRGKIVQEILYDDKYYDMKRVFEKLWPKLELIVLMKQGGYRVHTERIRKYTGNIKLYCPVYAIPEVTIGYDIGNDNTYTMDPRKGYFEFMPIKNTKTIKSIRNLQIGEFYNLVVSTRSSDMHRYMTGEVIRVLGYFNGAPKIDIICKEEDLIRIDGQIITPYCIETILMKDFVLVDYCYTYKDSDKLKLYIELDESSYLKEMDKVYGIKQNIKDIDILDHLLDQMGIQAEVRIVMPDTFDGLYRSRYCDEIDPAAIQIPRLLTDSSDMDLLRKKITYMF